MSIYTVSEQVIPKYRVQDAISAAKLRCEGRSICVNAVSGLRPDQPITLPELNDIADEIVADTQFYG